MGKAREQGFGPSLAFLYIKKENHKKIQTLITVCKTKVSYRCQNNSWENAEAASWELVYSCLALVLR